MHGVNSRLEKGYSFTLPGEGALNFGKYMSQARVRVHEMKNPDGVPWLEWLQLLPVGSF